MSPKVSVTAALASLTALAVSAPARADSLVAGLDRDTPIAAYGGVVAWSQYDARTDRYKLVLRRGGAAAPAPIAGARRPFDVSLGPDAHGRVVALYTRCRTATPSTAHGCDVYRLDVATGRERRVDAASSPRADEAWPVQWGDRVAFVRRARAFIKDAYDRRPTGRRGGLRVACDIPYVTTVSSGGALRALDRGPCAPTTGLSLRGRSIVQVTDVDEGGSGSVSDVRRLDARGGTTRVLARATGGDLGGYSTFASPSQSASAVWVTSTGEREGMLPRPFIRIDLASKRRTVVDPHVPLAGRFVRDERGIFWYVQAAPEDPEAHSEPPFCTGAVAACRLVRAAADPFSHAARTLLPEVSVDAGDGYQPLPAPATGPPVLSGQVIRSTVRDGAIVKRTPLAAITVELLRAAEHDLQPGRYRDTGRSTTTGTDGRWAFTLEASTPSAFYRAVAPVLAATSGPVAVAPAT